MEKLTLHLYTEPGVSFEERALRHIGPEQVSPLKGSKARVCTYIQFLRKRRLATFGPFVVAQQ